MYKNDDIRMHRADDKKNSITIHNIDYLAYAICVYTLVMLLLF